MNQHLQNVLAIIQRDENLSNDAIATVETLLKAANKELEITAFKLDRTEKVKRTTAILLEETIAELEQKREAIEKTNAALQQSLEELKAAQAQLIQAEKMASLGELTAGIAHEIQNPLNFVNNFSEVSRELLAEIKEELEKGNFADAKEIVDDVMENLGKILHHGKRADSIVKGMLQHSRTGSEKKEATDINLLVDEYFRLAYHGMRSKDSSFHVTFQTTFDEGIGSIEIIPQDVGRVLLNLLTNAFYAVGEKSRLAGDGYNPVVAVTTSSHVSATGQKQVSITVQDNGTGIPQKILDKIFQPFFTTKPTGQGTGLGLSLSYDIIKAHGGELKVETTEGSGTTFTISLPA